MKITDVEVSLVESSAPESGTVLCYATVTFDGVLEIRGFRLVRKGHRIVVDLPGRTANVDCVRCLRRIREDSCFCPVCGGRQPEREFIRRHPIVDVMDVRFLLKLTRALMDAFEAAVSNTEVYS